VLFLTDEASHIYLSSSGTKMFDPSRQEVMTANKIFKADPSTYYVKEEFIAIVRYD